MSWLENPIASGGMGWMLERCWKMVGVGKRDSGVVFVVWV